MQTSNSALKHAFFLESGVHSDLCPENECIDAPVASYMVWFEPGRTIVPGATHFGSAFNREDSVMAYSEALLQLVLRTVTTMRANYMQHVSAVNRDAAAATYEGDPIRVYLEVVLECDDDDDAGGGGGGAVDSEWRELLTLLDAVQRGDDDGDNEHRAVLDEEPYYKTRKFMRNVCDTVPVREYRVWVFVMDAHPLLNFGATLAGIVRGTEAMHAAFTHTAASGPSVTGKRKRGSAAGGGQDNGGGGDGEGGGDAGGGSAAAEASVAQSMSTYSGNGGGVPASNRFAAGLQPYERYRLIHNVLKFATVCDAMLGFEHTVTPSNVALVLNARTAWTDNPAHPSRTMHPTLYFDMPSANIATCQSKLTRYYDAERDAWHFPRTDLVLRLGHATQGVMAFQQKMMPDYQVRVLGRELASINAAQRVRAARCIAAPDIDVHANGDDDLDEELAEAFGAQFNMDPADARHALNDGRIVELMTDGDDATTTTTTTPRDPRGGAPHLRPFDASVFGSDDFEDRDALISKQHLYLTDSPNRSTLHHLVYLGHKKHTELSRLMVCARQYCDYVLAAAGGATRCGGMAARVECALQRVMRTKYLDMQCAQLSQYVNQCCSHASTLSNVHKQINLYVEHQLLERDTECLGSRYNAIDPRLSVFGTMVVRQMMTYETCAYASTCHRQLFTLQVGTKSAYHHELGKLNFNAMIWGSHATSKSFMLQVVRGYMIEGTVLSYGAQTDSAMYVDEDHNDEVVMCEEADPTLVALDSNKGDEQKRARFKDMLTSQVSEKYVFHTDESGKRGNRISYSQHIKSHVFCTNMLASALCPHIRSRFHMMHCVEQHREGRSPADLINIEERLDDVHRMRLKNARRNAHNEQALFFHAEKLIAIQALAPATLVVFDSTSQAYRRALSERFGVNLPVRIMQRMRMLVRTLVIQHAVHCVFSNCHSPCYGQRFEYAHFAHVNYLLHDSEEICYFAYSLLSEEITSKVRRRTIDVLLKLHHGQSHTARAALDMALATAASQQQQSSESTFQLPMQHTQCVQTPVQALENIHALYLMPDTIVSRDLAPNTASGPVAPSGVMFSALASGRANSRRDHESMYMHHQSSTNDASVTCRADDAQASPIAPEQMYAYCRFNRARKKLVEYVVKESIGSSMALSKDDVFGEFRAMSSDTMLLRRYEWDSARRVPVPHRIAARARMPAMFTDCDDVVYVHLDLLDSSVDVVDEAIRQCYSAHDASEVPRVFIDGKLRDANYPHLFDTRIIEPRSGHVVRVRDVAREITPEMHALDYELFAKAAADTSSTTTTTMTTTTQSSSHLQLTDGTEELTHSYDRMSELARARALFIDVDDDEHGELARCSFEPYNDALRRTCPPEAQQGRRQYPECFMSTQNT